MGERKRPPRGGHARHGPAAAGGSPGTRPRRERKTPRSPGRASAPRPADPVPPERYHEFGRRLRAWYRANCRDLPWRRTRDPYRVLLSELMLQQTQVSRVVPKYEEFLGRFPTLSHVAAAPAPHVMEAWRGLGYYARARNLHRLAQHVTRDGGPGALPADPTELRELT